MQVSQRISLLAQTPEFKVESVTKLTHKIEVNLPVLKSSVQVGFDTVTSGGELVIDSVAYVTELTGDFLGVLEGFIQLIKGKPVEALGRLGPKELDHFLRDTNSESAFEFYNKELYEVLSVGEAIFLEVFPREPANDGFDPKVHGAFAELSFSEQVEWFEEFCSKHIYKNPEFSDVLLDLEDINDVEVFVSTYSDLSAAQLTNIQDEFNKMFQTLYIFSKKR